MEPQKSVVPIFAIDEANNIKHFLGTGTFVERRPFLVTAEHVVRDWKGPFAIAVLPDIAHIFRASLIAKHTDIDIAVLEVPGYAPERGLQLAEDSEISNNEDIVCLEYGTTRSLGREIYLSPATRRGNVTRTLNLTDRLGKAGDGALELSFPALRGASGAPNLSNQSFKLWGIVVANVSYHLLSAQIESVLDEKAQIVEETRFMLPQAIAVHVKHVRAVL